jgi:Tfp pilus assembly protein PilF
MATAYPMIGKSYFLAKDYVKAREAYLKAADTALDLEAKRFRISSILLSGGDSMRALDYSRQLIAENPTDCDLSGNFSSLLYSMKRYDEVIKVLNDRMITCPDAPKATPYLFIGLSYLAKQKYGEAESALEKSIAADTNSFQGYFWLMNAYSQAKDFAKAGGMANVMLEHRFDTSHPKEVAIAYFFRGADRMNAKDFKAAVAEFERALKFNPEYASAYLYTAFAYQSMNDKDNACKYYKLTLKYEPGNADAKKYMKLIGCG